MQITKAGLTPATQIRNQDVPAWLSLILTGRPWPAPRRPPRITSCDSFGGQNRYKPSQNILKYSRQFLSTVRLGSCILSAGAVFSVFGARLPVFPAAHFAKVARLALSGLKQGNFYAPLAGKNFGLPSRYRAGKQHRLPTLKQRKKHTGHC